MKGFETLATGFYREHGLALHHIESFNDFLENKLQQIINENQIVEPTLPPPGIEEYKIKLDKIHLEKPISKEADGSIERIFPLESRMRNLTYSVPIWLDTIVIRDDIEDDPVRVNIGNLPVMVKSNICPLSKMTEAELIDIGEDPLDPGGYFIINGTERVLISIEDLTPNRLLLERKNKGPITSIGRLFSERRGYRVPHLFERRRNGVVTLTFARVTKIPAIIILRSLGLETDEQVVKAIEPHQRTMEDMYINLEEGAETPTTEDALDYIGRHMRIGQGREYRVQRVSQILDTYLLPHIGQNPNQRISKAYHIAKMMRRVVNLHFNLVEENDKDHYANKRLKLAGDLMESLFRVSFRVLINDIKYNFSRVAKRGKEPSIATIVRSALLTSRVESALATGNWVGGRRGISQHLQRLNFMDTLSHLRRVLSPLTTSQPHFEARELHPTHWGRLCASETPEGQNIGLRKNLALFARLTRDEDDKAILQELYNSGVKPVEE